MTLRATIAQALCAWLVLGPAWADTAQVTAATANLRSEPSTRSPVVSTVSRGARLEVLESSGEWLKIRVGGTATVGFIHRSLVEVSAAAPATPSERKTPPASAAPAGGAPVVIEHRDVGCVVAGQYPKFEACFNPGESVGRGRVLFRAAGTDPWYYVDMTPDGPCYSAVLPKPKPQLKGFEYFVDVMDKSFAESHKPERAPEQSFAPRVVTKQEDCDPARKVALFIPRLVQPIVIGIARAPSGSVLSAVAAKALESKLVLSGFAPDGVIVSATGAAPGASPASSSASSSSTGGSGGAGAGGGIPKIALIGGGIAAAGVIVAVAAGGGGGSGSGGSSGGSSGSGGSGGSSPTSPGGSASGVAGRWTGSGANGGGLVFTFGDQGVSCTSRYDIVANLTQTGSTVGGSMTYSGRSFTCTVPDPDAQQILNNILVPGDSGGFPVNGTATDSAVTIAGSGVTLAGPYTRSNMDLNGNLSESPGMPYTMTLKLTRQ
jgi:Bacterial SH3 domain